MREPSQRHVRRRARETFAAGQLDRSHPQSLDIARMPDRAHRDAIVNLEQFLRVFFEGQKENSVPVPERDNRAPGRKLRLDVLGAVRRSLRPNEYGSSIMPRSVLNTAAIFFSGNVVIPSADTILMIRENLCAAVHSAGRGVRFRRGVERPERDRDRFLFV